MRRFLVTAIVVLAASASLCRADDYAPGSFRRQVETALREGGVDRVVVLIDTLLSDATPRIRARHVEAAKAALDLLPKDQANPRAARLLGEALLLDRGDADGAWTAAQSLRKELLRQVDVETGEHFLAKLIELYPDVVEYREDRAQLLLQGGRRDEAIQELEAALQKAPKRPWSLQQLAQLRERDGKVTGPDGALALWDRLIAARPLEFDWRIYKIRAAALVNRQAARTALDEARRAADAASESTRADFLEKLDAERRGLDEADARRDDIARIENRIDLAMASALVAWGVVATLLMLATRAAPKPPATAATTEN